MAVKKAVRDAGGEDDFLGLVAFGSLITNIAQIARGKMLEDKHEALKKYARELERRYQETIRRNRQISDAYMSLKNMIQKLEKENAGLKAELNGLRASNAKRPRRRRIERKG